MSCIAGKLIDKLPGEPPLDPEPIYDPDPPTGIIQFPTPEPAIPLPKAA
jgi:hypothetical protein